MILGLIAAVCIIVLIDIRELLNKKNRMKFMAIYFFLIISGFVIALLQIIDIAPPSPSKVIESIVKFMLPGG